MKKTIITFISMLLLLSVFLTLLAGCRLIPDADGTSETPTPGPDPDSGIVPVLPLAIPTEVSFDSDTYILSWSAVEHASAYLIWYNGTEILVDVNDAQEQLTISATENSFKVKAIGDKSYYSDSDWSAEVSYILPVQQLSVFEKVNLKLAQVAEEEKMELVSVIGIMYANVAGNNYGDNIIIGALCTKDDVTSYYNFIFKCPGHSSVEEILNDFDNATLQRCVKRKIVEYNSIHHLLNSHDFEGSEILKRFFDAGYTITCLAGCVLEGKKEGSKFVFEVIGTFAATREGADAQYFTTQIRIKVSATSSNVVRNYEDSLEFGDYRTLADVDTVLHQNAGTMSYIGEWASKNGGPDSPSTERKW